MAKMRVKACDNGLKSSMRGWCWVSEEVGYGEEVDEGSDKGFKSSRRGWCWLSEGASDGKDVGEGV